MSEIIHGLKGRHPQIHGALDSIALLASQKQIHQLTTEVINFLDHSAGILSGEELVQFFDGCVSKYAERMNPLELLRIIQRCSRRSDIPASVGFQMLDKFSHLVLKSKDATVLSKVYRAELHLRKSKDVGAARSEIDAVSELLRDPMWSHSVSGSIRGLYHLEAAEMYLALGSNDLEFYAHLVKYLTYTPLEEMADAAIPLRTKQAGVIALVNPAINDFGELLSLRVFQDLDKGASLWLVDFLRAVHLGDFVRFDAAVKAHGPFLKQHEAALMVQIESSLVKKLTMIALSELATAFKTPPCERRLSFDQISKTCRVPISEVETLVMTTMGTGLISGTIDEVEATVHITAVQPRMLDLNQMTLLKSRIDKWACRASELLGGMKEIVTPELLVD